MREELYFQSREDRDLIMKVVKDPEEGIFTGYVWNYKKKEWVEAWPIVCGYYNGFDDARTITKEMAEDEIQKRSL